MKKDLIVERAKQVISKMGLNYHYPEDKYYLSIIYEKRHELGSVKKQILNLAKEPAEQNFVFVEKVVKQINLFLL